MQIIGMLKATHSLAIYPNHEILFVSALQFMKQGLDNNEVVILLSDKFARKRVQVSRYLYKKKYPESIQKTGFVNLGGDIGSYFLVSRGNINFQKVLYSWTEIIHEAERLGKGLRAFVELVQVLSDDTIVERLIRCKSEVDTALYGCDSSFHNLKIMNGCLESDILGLASESFRLIQQYQNGVYVIPIPQLSSFPLQMD
jgi:hypothetical protein